ncbi:hypothetical protein ACGF7V_32705, partial [Streptomyces sp. NPDC047725]
MPGQYLFHLTRLDPEPPDLHLLIHPAQELQLTVPTPPATVTRPIHPLTRHAERIRHEPARRQTRPAQIPPRHTHTRHIQLTRNTRRHRPQRGIK